MFANCAKIIHVVRLRFSVGDVTTNRFTVRIGDIVLSDADDADINALGMTVSVVVTIINQKISIFYVTFNLEPRSR